VSEPASTFFLREAGEDPHDNPPKPFSTSKTSNWVARAGGLPPYVQHVAHALVKKGEDESSAIGKAVGIIKNWKDGKGGVHKAIKAAAAKAWAEWVAKKGSTAAKGAVKTAEALNETEQLIESTDLLLEAGELIGGEALVAMLTEAKLSTAERDKLPSSSFAIPEKREYPIHDEEHARKAIQLSGGKAEHGRVVKAVAKRYKGIKAQEAELIVAEGLYVAALQESTRLVEAAPAWMIPVAARQPGFHPLKPEKKSSTTKASTTSGGGAFDSKHPRGYHGKFIQGGSKGIEVTAIQHRLQIARTGTFGGNTKKAVERFQKNHGLQVDGVVGKQTIAALRGNTNASSVSTGALTHVDRRYLRRLAKRT
jgi:murein L,D-transpeptidase YcbB/YkuD